MNCRSGRFGYFVAFSLIALLPQAQCLQYITNSSLPSANLTADCANALMANISCDSYIAGFHPGVYHDPTGLAAVCTGECGEALNTYEAGVSTACAGQAYNYTDTVYYPISAIPDQLGYFFNRTCLEDSGRYCNYVSYEASIASDSNAQQILGKIHSHSLENAHATDFQEMAQAAEGQWIIATTALSKSFRLTQAHHSVAGLTWYQPSVL